MLRVAECFCCLTFRPMLRAILAILFFLTLPPLFAVPVFQTLVEFERAGTIPAGHLVAHPDGNYYGTTVIGGRDDFGTIYQMTPAGAVTTLVSFTGAGGAAKGAFPSAGLMLAADGALYGTTTNGGADDYGTVFKVTTAGVFTSLLDFTGMTGAKKGSVPNPLFLHSDGFFYGSTQAGGINDMGTIFKMTAAGALTTLAELSGTSAPNLGAAPSGRLIVSGTVIYGTAQWGGMSDCGTVFSLPTSGNSFTTRVNFSGMSGARRGCGPNSGVTLIGTTLYGTTEYGGVNDFGTIFKVETNGAGFVTMRDFAETDGAFPAAQLLALGDGFLYGSTTSGGAGGVGVLFKIPAISPFTYSVLNTFSEETGAGPRGGLTLGQNGELFGITEAGGMAGNGTAFQMSTTGTFATLATFSTPTGWEPIGAPLAATNGVVIPLRQGGLSGRGTSLHIGAGSAITLENTFGASTDAPAGGFIEASGSRLGLSKSGVLYRLSPSLPPEILSTLNGTTGQGNGELTDGNDGYFYGVSTVGGPSSQGTVFRISPLSPPSLVAAFSGANGQNPSGPLALGLDGNFYGTTENGGSTGSGTVFKVEPGGTLTTLLHFASTGPRKPVGGLVASVDGNFYGTTKVSGAAGYGAVFRITPLGSLTVLAQFSGGNGSQPGAAPSRLLAACDGTLYGTTESGGTSDQGTIFRITPLGTFEHLFSFSGVSGDVRGKAPGGHLSFSDGSAHGVTPQGGVGGGGTAFRVMSTGPHAATRPASRINAATLGLSATVQAGGEVTTVLFDYGPTPALGLTTAPADAANAAQITPPPPGQTVHFRARAANASGISQGFIRTYTSPTPAAQWKFDHLGSFDAPDLGDPDSDGLATILEYALVMHPGESNTAPPASRVNFPEGPRLTIAVARDPVRNDITIEVQAAPTPSGPWTAVATSTSGASFSGPGYVTGEISGNAVRTVQIKDSAATPSEQRRFLRVRVVH